MTDLRADQWQAGTRLSDGREVASASSVRDGLRTVTFTDGTSVIFRDNYVATLAESDPLVELRSYVTASARTTQQIVDEIDRLRGTVGDAVVEAGGR